MGWLVGAILQKRWLTLAGVVLIVGSVFLPRHTALPVGVGVLGLCLMLAQIPLMIRAERRKRQAPPHTEPR
jgi:hypothetical protein